MIVSLLVKLKLKAFYILPISGFILGYLLQWLFSLRGRPKYESITVHLITSILWVFLFSDLYFNYIRNENSNGNRLTRSHKVDDFKDIGLYLILCYTFILACATGLITDIL